MLQDKLAAAKSVAEVAKLSGAVSDTLFRVTFAQPVFVRKVGQMEPALSGISSLDEKGTFKTAVRGNGAVYAYEVLAADKQDTKFDEKAERDMLVQTTLRFIGGFQAELYDKADIEDRRYIFY